MNKNRKFLSLVSLGMLLVLFGGGFAILSRNVQAQAESPAVVDDDSSGENEPDEADEVAPANTGITAEQAQARAEAETGSTTLGVEFDIAGGIQIFEVEMTDGTDVEVDASDGTIIRIKQRDED